MLGFTKERVRMMACRERKRIGDWGSAKKG